MQRRAKGLTFNRFALMRFHHIKVLFHIFHWRGGILFAIPRTFLYRGSTVYSQQNNLDIEFDHIIQKNIICFSEKLNSGEN